MSDEEVAHKKREKQKAKDLRKTQWWRQKLDAGLCHFCGDIFERSQLTMDHLVPLSRGGKSSKGNIVPACKECNTKKKYHTPVDMILSDQMKKDVSF